MTIVKTYFALELLPTSSQAQNIERLLLDIAAPLGAQSPEKWALHSKRHSSFLGFTKG
jgi:hypothetical protein